ncbi:MAG: S-adenosylmethionine:tRNA ribosyltransferase-isomerase [Frankiaceae bacterium]
MPAGAAATEPPEERGLARDGVRLLVAWPGGLRHAVFADIGDFLAPGDLLVVNDSATLAAAVDGHRRGEPVTVHFSTGRPDGAWVVELRAPAPATGPLRDARPGDLVELPAGASITLLAAHPDPLAGRSRLWRGIVAVEGPVEAYLARHGRPITYGYVTGRWPLAAYQTVFAREPGSAEMPSAGRPFSTGLVTSLVSRGVLVAPVTLHAGVSSLEAGEPPQPEPFRVPVPTARLVQHVRRSGGRVVAVGTTVTRALETVAAPDGTVRPGTGWTDLVLGPDRPARVVTGLVTGWHEPGASHLLLLEAVAGAELVRGAYAEAVRAGYRWHELGDSCLLLPEGMAS